MTLHPSGATIGAHYESVTVKGESSRLTTMYVQHDKMADLTRAAEISLKAGKNVLVAAHGNSLRAVVKMLDNVSEADITELNIPTGVPLVYELDANLKPIKSGYLGDPEAIKAAAEAVKKQTEKKK